MDATNPITLPLTAAQVSWTDERIEQLKSLWAKGFSCSLIGEEMGVTRNAVIGKVHRLNLSSREIVMRKRKPGATGDPVAIRRPIIRKRPKVERRSGGVWARIDSILRDANKASTDLPVDSSPFAVSIEGLLSDRSQCRYPVTTPEGEPQLFCAAEVVSGTAYCARHCAVCFTRRARPYGEPQVSFFQSIGDVALRIVSNLEAQRRDNDQAA